jgi:peptide deformylase
MTDSLVDQTADAFVAALVEWRRSRGLSKKQLAADMGFDPSYVSHVEARRHRPTEDFARRAELVLNAGGALWQRFREYDEARHQTPAPTVPRPRSDPGPIESRPPSIAGVVVEHEQADLRHVGDAYRCVVRRRLYNAGRDPVTRYLVRIAVDRYPNEPERSNRHYRDHPLTWAELDLTAGCEGEPMSWRAKHDRDAFKEVWLLFENDEARFPLYPGQRTTIEYAYTVGTDKWGHWFQRAVRLPTSKLSVRLDFPAHLRPVVWGVETSLTAEAGALRSPVIEQRQADRVLFSWSTEDPQLNARYRFEWRFREPVTNGAGPAGGPDRDVKRPSDLMRTAGIVQRGAPMLDRAARWLDLPAQAPLATDVVASVLDALERVSELHEFGKGIGLAAPQLGIDWAAAVVRAPDDADGGPVVLLNPKVVGESLERDEQYEGCLSFFDVRGVVSRPLLIEVEHTKLDGERTISTFRNALARLVAHEIDHLGGLLYTDRMPPDAQLMPAESYPGGGQPWRY